MLDYGNCDTFDQLERLIQKYQRTRRTQTVDFRQLLSEFGKSDRVTHQLHPYPAKLLAQIPFFFLANNWLSEPGDLVADPFCGSGTVPLEAQLAGRTAFGGDVNPFATLLAKVKTTPLCCQLLEREHKALRHRIPDVPWSGQPDVVNLHHWFHPPVIQQLHCLLDAIRATSDPNIRDFFLVAFSNCVRRVSNADPRLSVPVRLRKGRYPKGHHLRRAANNRIRELLHVNVFDEFDSVLRQCIARMRLLSQSRQDLPSCTIKQSDARELVSEFKSGAAPGRAQLVITSPPYPGAQKYIRSCSLSLGWLGLCEKSGLMDLKRLAIGREEFRKREHETLHLTDLPAADAHLKKLFRRSSIRAAVASAYLREMREAIDGIWSLLRPGGYFVLIASNNQIAGETFRANDYLLRLAEQRGFDIQLRAVDTIRSRGLMTKRNRTASVITREYVTLMQKGAPTPNVAS